MPRRPPSRAHLPIYNRIVHIPVTTALKTALELEAWERQENLSEYLRGLLERRAKAKKSRKDSAHP